METKPIRPYVVLVCLLLGTVALVELTVNASRPGKTGVRYQLPNRVGEWTGWDVRYCQNECCLAEFRAKELRDPTLCPQCGSRLDSVSLSEKLSLPPDTVVLRKGYTDSDGYEVIVSIVLSGAERSSIHRAEWCLKGQGYAIERQRIIDIPINAHRKPLQLCLMDISRASPAAADGRFHGTAYFAYWFVGGGRETPYHLARLWWIAVDSIVHNVWHQWAYIGISGKRTEGSDEHIDRLKSFVREFHPLVVNKADSQD